MYKVIFADKDTYITNRITGNIGSGTLRTSSNVGRAGTLDLFKLYGATISSGNIPNVELSRLLLHFDLSSIQQLANSGKINLNSDRFNCRLKLFDVYGGQTTPSNFEVSVFPLSRSFSEGEGRDVVYYSDFDAANFLTSSYAGGSWFTTGCGFSGGATQLCDYITGSSTVFDYEVKQHFVTGEEDLDVDVTTIISSTLANEIPNSGFRLSLASSHESDAYSYFVKRFASRSAYNSSKHPRLIVRYDDSLNDDSQLLQFDSTSTLFLRNYSRGSLTNVFSGSSLTPITGSNCMILRMVMNQSNGAGPYSLSFSASQHTNGTLLFEGIYSSSFLLNQNNPIIRAEILKSGSIMFVPIWGSLDGSVGYHTGSAVYVYPPRRTSTVLSTTNYTLSTTGLLPLHRSTEQAYVRLNIFDYASPQIKLVKQPIVMPGIVVQNAFYQIRNITTNEVIIPFDSVYNSTRLSSDDSGMYFTLDMSSLPKDNSYVVDILLDDLGIKKIYNSVSNKFNVSDIQTI